MRTTVLTAVGDFPVDTQTIGLPAGVYPAPASVTQSTAATLTPAQLLAGVINTAPAGAINLQLPTAASLDAALSSAAGGNAFPANSAFEFSVVNTAGGAFAATLTTNTGWTLLGSMAVAQNVSARFQAKKTAAGAWTLTRLS